MAAMGEPSQKKAKTNEIDHVDPIFAEFINDRQKMKQLRNAYLVLRHGFSFMSICLVHIDDANARTPGAFSRASATTSYIKDTDGSRKTFELGSIFMYGLSALHEFTHTEKPLIPADVVHRRALAKLLQFLSIDHPALYAEKNYDGREGDWALTLAQHLLSPLAVVSKYTIDSNQEFRRTDSLNCPCEAKDELVGLVDDTSFGCSNGWHGRADILMAGLLPVEFTTTPEEEWCDYAEVKTADNFLNKDLKQIMAQTIVFSFLKRKENKSDLKNLLIPGLGISSKKVMAFFYESEEDVLLETPPMVLLVDSKINFNTIVFLWLTLNYKQFCSGITAEMKNYKADFFERVGDFIEVYRNDVCRHVSFFRSEESKADHTDWAHLTAGQGGVEVKRLGLEYVDPFTGRYLNRE